MPEVAKHNSQASGGVTPMKYFLALAGMTAALLLRLALDKYFGGALPYLPLLAGATFAAWYCGLWPAVLSTVLGMLAADYLLELPEQSFAPLSWSHSAATLSFLLTVGAIIAISEQNRWNRAGRLPSRVREPWQWTDHAGEFAIRPGDEDFDFQLATRLAGIGIWMWDMSGKEMRWSAEQKLLYGLPEEVDVDREMFYAMLHPDDREHVISSGERAMRDKTEFRGEFRIVLADGSTRWIGSRGRVLADERGNAVRMGGANWDITDRRIAQEHLARSEERLRLAQEAGNVGTWEWDPDADVTSWSAQIYQLLGIAPSDPLYQKAWLASIAEEDREAWHAVQLRVLREGAAEIEYCYRHPQKGMRWIFSRLRMVPTSGGKKVMLGISIDITERKQIAER
jgi:PAS domain S-box-containing protein